MQRGRRNLPLVTCPNVLGTVGSSYLQVILFRAERSSEARRRNERIERQVWRKNHCILDAEDRDGGWRPEQRLVSGEQTHARRHRLLAARPQACMAVLRVPIQVHLLRDGVIESHRGSNDLRRPDGRPTRISSQCPRNVSVGRNAASKSTASQTEPVDILRSILLLTAVGR